MLDFPSLLYKGLRILMFQLSGVYCINTLTRGTSRYSYRYLTRKPTYQVP